MALKIKGLFIKAKPEAPQEPTGAATGTRSGLAGVDLNKAVAIRMEGARAMTNGTMPIAVGFRFDDEIAEAQAWLAVPGRKWRGLLELKQTDRAQPIKNELRKAKK